MAFSGEFPLSDTLNPRQFVSNVGGVLQKAGQSLFQGADFALDAYLANKGTVNPLVGNTYRRYIQRSNPYHTPTTEDDADTGDNLQEAQFRRRLTPNYVAPTAPSSSVGN